MKDPNATTVAVLGTGTMGTGMAHSLARAGFTLQVWNRSRDRAEPLADVGATVCDTAEEAVRGADVVLTMVWDAESVAEVIRAAAPGLREGTVWVQTSTVGVEGAQRLAKLAEQQGLVFVDSPVLGTKQPAENGELVVVAAGPARARAVADPVLDAIGNRTIWVGEQPGSASALKLIVNSWLVTIVEGVAEALTAARVLGLDPQLFLDAVHGGVLDAPFVGVKGGAMLRGAFEPSFSLAAADKDARLALHAVAAAGLDSDDLGVFAAARSCLERAVDEGHGGQDVAATYLGHGRS
jgi:3-hydroxyisobutyrate dehydrogenase